ncbi:hypothetical protein SCHPADRAFT_67767 [Schizopora paradoxa]|uniref:Uncharacterized protein n=1 Tax=Schizopora paradoxa TaxID=27342 RepID=A0A0H2S5P1_9AGAM|nr:hypothetical protein SCHPADRAFT_67767 [Schizopora paradoxa]
MRAHITDDMLFCVGLNYWTPTAALSPSGIASLGKSLQRAIPCEDGKPKPSTAGQRRVVRQRSEPNARYVELSLFRRDVVGSGDGSSWSFGDVCSHRLATNRRATNGRPGHEGRVTSITINTDRHWALQSDYGLAGCTLIPSSIVPAFESGISRHPIRLSLGRLPFTSKHLASGKMDANRRLSPETRLESG